LGKLFIIQPLASRSDIESGIVGTPQCAFGHVRRGHGQHPINTTISRKSGNTPGAEVTHPNPAFDIGTHAIGVTIVITEYNKDLGRSGPALRIQRRTINPASQRIGEIHPVSIEAESRTIGDAESPQVIQSLEFAFAAQAIKVSGLRLLLFIHAAKPECSPGIQCAVVEAVARQV
tara:strand:- start:59 stop:583 length:525 start_codon:yes stop_codon:yes gene_type:complete